MTESFREQLVLALPTLCPLSGYMLTLIVLMILLNKKRFQLRKQRGNDRLEEVLDWVEDSIACYSTHYAHLTSGAFTEDEVIHKLAKLSPTRQQAGRQVDQIADPGLNAALETFHRVERGIFSLVGERSVPDPEAYREQLAQLRSAGERIMAQVALLKI